MSEAIIYCRYSPRKEKDCESLEFQEDQVRRHFQFHGIEVGPVLKDAETSARLIPLSKRKDGARLMDLTTGRHPQYSIVGAYRMDRLWRNVVDGITTLDIWQKVGVSLHLSSEGGQSLNTATATGRLLVNTLLVHAAFEPELTAERTSHGMLRNQSNGWAQSKEPPYGKRPGPVVAQRRTWIDDEDEQAIIRRICAYDAQGLSDRAIARKLNAQGVPARGERWYHSSVGSVLRRAKKATAAC